MDGKRITMGVVDERIALLGKRIAAAEKLRDAVAEIVRQRPGDLLSETAWLVGVVSNRVAFLRGSLQDALNVREQMIHEKEQEELRQLGIFTFRKVER